MAGPYLPILALTRSQNVRIGNAQGGVVGVNRVPGEVGTDIRASGAGVLGPIVYVDLSDGSSRRDLQRHGAIGAYVVVGSLTSTNLNIVVTNGVATTADGSDLVITVSAGQIKNRTTAVVTAVAGGTTTLAAADTVNPRIDLISVNNTTGAVTHVTGTPAASPVAPAAATGTTAIASVAVAANATSVSQSNVTDLAGRV